MKSFARPLSVPLAPAAPARPMLLPVVHQVRINLALIEQCGQLSAAEIDFAAKRMRPAEDTQLNFGV